MHTALELPDDLNKKRSPLVGHFQENLGHAVEAVIDTVEQLAKLNYKRENSIK